MKKIASILLIIGMIILSIIWVATPAKPANTGSTMPPSLVRSIV